MLVLTRKLNEQIKIGNDITITVIKLRNNQIRLGIDAPRDVRVLRAELEKIVATTEFATEEPSSENAGVETAGVSTAVSTAGTPRAGGQTEAPYGIRNEAIDGLVSTEEMIEASLDSDDDGGESFSVPEAEATEQPAFKVFSGKIGVDGELRENTPSRANPTACRAPLAAYFTAP